MSLPSRERGLKYRGLESQKPSSRVAPLAGAWIEIARSGHERAGRESLPSRERGLKYRLSGMRVRYAVSLPSRERGLKSEPTVKFCEQNQSLPSRERGLKLKSLFNVSLRRSGRSPRGSVD